MAKLRRIKKSIKSYITPEAQEIYEQIELAVLGLSDGELRDQYIDALASFKRTGNLADLLEPSKWKRKVVDIDEFLFGKQYMALEKNFIYPAVIDACHDLDSDKYIEAVLKGALGTGKSTLANVMLARSIYKISCMRDPQMTFGVQPRSSLVFTIQSVRFNTAKKAVFEELGQYLGKSPYFSTIFPYDPKVTSQMIFRDCNLSILPVSSSGTGVISMNVLGGILDEMNFMVKVEKSKSSEADAAGSFDQAKNLYDTIARRRRSRFTKQGKLPGMLFLVSSSRFPDDFTEKKALESTMAGGTDPSIYVYSHSQWSAKPRDTFLPETFNVCLGSETIRPKILTDKDKLPEGCEVIEVPMDFYTEFQKDIEGSIRDFAGRTSLSTSPFIMRRDAIRECQELAEKAGYYNIFEYEQVDLEHLPSILHDRIRLDVPSPRALHLDLAINGDACGIACGHIAGARYVEKINPDTGRPDRDILPVYGIDFALRVNAPPNGEIEFASIRKLIFDLRDRYKLPITWVTSDGFQSTDMRQILRKRGFITDYVSVDSTADAYVTLRESLYEGRLLLPRHHFLAKELAELERSVKNNKLIVDHRPNSSKDVADAVCGVVALLAKRRSSWVNTLPTVTDKNELSLFGNEEFAASIQMLEDTDTVKAGFLRHSVIAGRKDIIRRDIVRK